MRRLALLAALLAACDGDPPPPPARPPEPVTSFDPAVLRLAGTGAMWPLATRLARAWADRGGAPRVLVVENVGSAGGLRAARDGAIDVGMVSRPLTAEEERFGLAVVPVARDVVIVAANAHVPVRELSSAMLRDLHAGRATQFADGTPAVLLLRDPDESANLALDAAVPGLAALRQAAYRRGGLRVLYHDDAMGAALSSTPGALGVFSLAAVRAYGLPLAPLALDGVAPSPEAVADGRWKASRPLAFAVRPDRLAHARPFFDFARSPAGRELARAVGCLPEPSGGDAP